MAESLDATERYRESRQRDGRYRATKDFPHESTVDQWFNESQFESYRALGLHVVEEITAGAQRPMPAFESFEKAIHVYMKKPPPAGVYPVPVPKN